VTNFTTKNIVNVKVFETLAKRADFVAASKAEKFVGNSIIVQARYNASENIRVGYTASKKVGNAVARNRAKRRMSAAALETLAQYGTAGADYVLIGRAKTTCTVKFEDLKFELTRAIKKLSARLK
jgi:ribonuclease P protein component